MNEIVWRLDLQVKDGPKFPLNDTFKMEAIDKIDVLVPAAGSVKVHVQPGDLREVEFTLVMRVDKPGAAPAAVPAKKLYYQVGDDDTHVELDTLHLLMGYGAVNLLKQAPEWLTFTNEQDKDASVIILIGRQAAVQPEAPGAESGQAGGTPTKTDQPAGGQASGQPDSGTPGAQPAQTAPAGQPAAAAKP